MHTGSFLVAALAAVASVAVAEEMRPKIYFPRHVKRQFTNSTITSHAPIPPMETPKETPLTGTAPLSTKRETTEPDFISSLGDPLSQGGASSSVDGSKSTLDDQPVTTVVSTVVVTPSSFPTDTSLDLPTTVSVPDLGIFPTTSPDTATLGKTNSSTPTTSSDTGIVIWPTGVDTSSTSLPLPSTTLGPIDSIVSSIVSQLTSAVLPSHNATGTDVLPTLTDPLPTTTSPLVTISLPIPTSLPTTVSVSIPTVSVPTVSIPTVTLPPPTSVNITTVLPPISTPPISTPPISTPPISTPPISTTILPPPPVTNTTLLPPPPTTVINNTDTSTPTPPPITSTVLPPPVSSPNVTAPATNITIPTGPTSTSIMTSVPTIGTLPPSQSWLPSTILIQPTPTAASSTPTAVPTGLPQLITPENGNQTIPAGTSIIQIGFLFPLNWEFVSTTPQSAAQLIQTLPQVLAYQAGTEDTSLTQVKQLVQFNTMKQYGYLTTLAYCTYPTAMVDKLSVDINIPTVRLFNNPVELARNLSAQINTAIGITFGSTLNSGASPSTGGTAATSTNGVFGNEGQPQTPAQQATTAGLAVGSVAVAVAYGAAMFVVARRYKRKKQSHHRTSSVTNPSEMRHTASPALMGGALLSRDFTSSYGGVAGGRDSHGSGRSGMNNSGRTAYISAPVAAENSLGWN